MTKEIIQIKKYLQKQENEKLDNERGVRKSSRIKAKRAMKCSDEKIPENVTEAKQSFEWAHQKKAMNDEMASLERSLGFGQSSKRKKGNKM